MINLPIKLAEAKEANAVFLIELYDIYLPAGDLHYAACDVDIVFNETTYIAAPIQRDTVKATTDSKVDNTKLTVSDFDSSFTLALLTGYNFLGCRCVIFQIMYPDALTDVTLAAPIFWGDLDSPVLNTKNATFEVDVVAPTTNLENARTMQLPCNAQFADQESCMGSLDVRTGTVQGGSTVYTVVIQQNEPENYRQYGIITVGYETRLIVSSVGSVITVDYPFRNVPTGSYSIQCGCDKSTASCNIHGQRGNYSGFTNVPFEYSIKS
jgi:hypothetical protein